MKKFALFLIVFLFTAFTGSFAARYYVAWLASGVNDGSSWDDAFNSMNTAINSTSTGDTIFVASGLYPCSTGSRDESINLKQGVVILGCFAGDEDPICSCGKRYHGKSYRLYYSPRRLLYLWR